MTELEITTRVWKCADFDTSRYALGNLLVIPRREGGAWIVATDGRCASVTPVDGTCDAKCFLPGNLVKGKLPVTATLAADGEWKTSRGTVGRAEEGRYPDVKKLLATVECDVNGPVAPISPRLLSHVRKACSEAVCHEGIVIMPQSGLIPLLAAEGDGFGIIHPMHNDHNDPHCEWLKRRDAFIADWDRAHEAPELLAARDQDAVKERE